MKEFVPKIFDVMKTYSKGQFIKDVVAGIIVAIIALPLSIALALASGVSPEQGIYTAIFAGFVISFLGGSRVQIAGPTAAFATIVAGIVAKNGMDGLIVATIMAGIILVIMGFLKFGNLIRFIPYTITTGFTFGIAVTIVIGQIKDFLGLTYPAGTATVETMDKLKAVVLNIGTFNVKAFIVGVVALAILIIWPKFKALDKIPPSLIAVIVSVVMVKFIPALSDVNTIGSLYTIKKGLPAVSIPSVNIDMIMTLLPDALTIAVLAGIESLLSCVVSDGMIGSRHKPNMELVAQGAGNIVSALFGGIPATGAIARTAANIKSGGKTPVAGMVHSITLLLILVVLMPYAALIPMPAIAAILFQVAYNMCQWRPFVHLVKTAPKSDISVLVLTFVLTIVFDLVVAIEIGLLLTCLLFMKRMSDETDVRSWKYAEDEWDDTAKLIHLPLSVRVYEINGPLFFGAAGRIAEISVKDFTKCLIIRMRSVPAIDATAMNALEELYNRCSRQGIIMIFSHVNEQPMHTMEKAGFLDKVGREHFCTHIDDAIAMATEISGNVPSC